MAQVNINKVWASVGDVDDPLDPKYLEGWAVEIPSYQNFNFVLNGIDQNILKIAQEGVFDYQNDVTYIAGGEVRDPADGKRYWSLSDANVGNLLSDSGNWSQVCSYGVDPSTVLATEGLVINGLFNKTSNLWQSTDVTIKNSSALINLMTTTAHDNWMIGNVRGVLKATNTGTLAFPDNRDLVTDPLTYDIFHGGNPPTITEVGGIEPNLVDNKYYVRQNAVWIEVILDPGTF